MKVFIDKGGISKNMDFRGSVAELLSALNIAENTVIVIRNNALVTEKDDLRNDDDIKILSVISGG